MRASEDSLLGLLLGARHPGHHRDLLRNGGDEHRCDRDRASIRVLIRHRATDLLEDDQRRRMRPAAGHLQLAVPGLSVTAQGLARRNAPATSYIPLCRCAAHGRWSNGRLAAAEDLDKLLRISA